MSAPDLAGSAAWAAAPMMNRIVLRNQAQIFGGAEAKFRRFIVFLLVLAN
jgi:hypothetical protein